MIIIVNDNIDQLRLDTGRVWKGELALGLELAF